MAERNPVHIIICFAVTIIPAAIVGFANRPMTSDHVGLILAAVISAGFIWWTSANLISGVYTSKQGVYPKTEAPLRYWINTVIIALFTVLAIYFLIHQLAVVSALG